MKNFALVALMVFMSSSSALADPVSYLCTFRAGPDSVSSVVLTNDGTPVSVKVGARMATIQIADMAAPRWDGMQTVTVSLAPAGSSKKVNPFVTGTITAGQAMFQFLAQTTTDDPGVSDISLFCQL